MDFRAQYSQLLNRSGSDVVNHRKDINILSCSRSYENSPKKHSEVDAERRHERREKTTLRGRMSDTRWRRIGPRRPQPNREIRKLSTNYC